MFGLFKKRKTTPPPLPASSGGQSFDSSEPRPQHLYFSHYFLPISFDKDRDGYFKLLTSPFAEGLMHTAWTSYGDEHVPPNERLQPAGLSVNGIRHANTLCFCFQFPPVRAAGEAAYALLVFAPLDLSALPDSFESVPFRYFLLERIAPTVSAIKEWTPSGFKMIAPSLAITQPDFVGEILERFYDRSPSTTMPRSDANMKDAIARARSELPAVIKRFVAGELHDKMFSVKVPISDGETIEYFWLGDTTYADGRFSGIIDAEPATVSTVTKGSRYSAATEDVTDWMYYHDGEMYGNYTLRAALPFMAPDQAARWGSIQFKDG